MSIAIQKQNDAKTSTENSLRVLLRREGVLPEKFQRKIERCAGTKRANCIGTALYIAGELKSDIYIDGYSAFENLLRRLECIEKPLVGCLIAWKLSDVLAWDRDMISHMGIVTHTDPILVTNRHGSCGCFIENEIISELDKEYSEADFTKMFFLPRTLKLQR